MRDQREYQRRNNPARDPCNHETSNLEQYMSIHRAILTVWSSSVVIWIMDPSRFIIVTSSVDLIILATFLMRPIVLFFGLILRLSNSLACSKGHILDSNFIYGHNV